MNNLHFIGNAHLDPVWLWRWQEGFSEITATFRSALDRMNDFPDFKFTSACSVYYQWIEKVDPDMFEEIKQRVKEGRWNIVGGWFLQPDCNIPDGESFARHALISQRYFKEKFGITVKTGYNVDSFGHNASLPKILKKSGMDNYIFMRPDHCEKELKQNIFVWESDDGSRVNTFRIPFFYNFDKDRVDKHTEEIQKMADEYGNPEMVFYGVGNHGGGPTIKLINYIKEKNIKGMVLSTPDEYFNALDKSKLPVVSEELQHHARGCYSACSFVKKNNRKCENNLIAAERLCLMAEQLTGAKYPREKLQKAWKNVLFNQFHDILGGCSIKKAYEDAGHLFGETMSITEQAINYATHKICRNIDTLKGSKLPAFRENHWQIWEHEVLGTPVVVFNPHCHKVKVPVTVNLIATKVTDALGNEIPFQKTRNNYINGWEKYSSIFTAEVEPLGYAVYKVFAEQKSETEFKSELSITKTSLENSKIKVEFDLLTGDIGSIYDKENDKYIISKPCRAILADDTANDTWAHGRFSLGETVGMFDTPEFIISEEGPVRATLRVKTKYNNSLLIRDYSITADSKEVTVKTKVDFHEKHRILKFAFPVDAKEIIAKIPYGTVTRPMYSGEEPCGSWMAAGGLCIANDSKYAYDTEKGELRLTVLRSAIYADHFAGEHRDEYCEFMEQGEHEFTYSIFPYETPADAERKAEVLNFAPVVSTDSFHDGSLDDSYSAFKCDSDDIIVTAIKKSEDVDGKIIRFYEANGKDTNADIKLFGKEIKTAVSHNEIKIFNDDAKELNIIEWEE